MKLKKLSPISSIIGMSVLMLAAQPAVALDAKTLPGAACQPRNQTDAFTKDSFGRFFNPSSTKTLAVVCPVVRDTMTADSIRGITSTFVMVVDQNTSSGVTCALFSAQKQGGAIEAQAATSAGASTTPQQLNFFDLQSVTDGYYYMNCTIPPAGSGGQSGIVSYKVEERS